MASKSFDLLIEQIGNLTVLELNDFVKALESKFGVTAAAPAAVMASGSQAGDSSAKKEDEKSEYKVELIEAGEAADKIKVIKALRSVTSLGLIEAKEKVENVPTVIAEAIAKDDAKKMKDALEAVGAKVKLS